MLTIRVSCCLFCLIFIIAILHDAFEVMLLPRRVKNKTRIVRYFIDATWAVWSAVGRRLHNEEKRNNFLSLYGPLSLVLMLLFWAAGLIFAFGGVFAGVQAPQVNLYDWLNDAYLSGVTFFTLGYGDIVPHSGLSKLTAVVEAGTGLGFIALVIGYLPVIYQLFSRRESHVLTLDAIAGSPPCAVTLVSRFVESGSVEALDHFLLRWQQWCAELLESQLSYPMLAYYRSQHDNQSWLAALTVITDACVLIMVGLGVPLSNTRKTGTVSGAPPKGLANSHLPWRGAAAPFALPTLQARLTFATARLAIFEMGRVLGVKPRGMEVDRLPASVFVEMTSLFDTAGLAFVEEDAEARLAAFRATYEPFLNGLAGHLILPLPSWVAKPGHVDNWVNTPRGRSIKRLYESVDVKPQTED